MDDDIERIVKKVFPSDDVKFLGEMIDIVSKDMSDSNRAKRAQDLESVLNEMVR